MFGLRGVSQKHHLPKAPILQIGPPSPPPAGPLQCQLDWDNKRHPLPRLPFPSKRRSGGWGVGVPKGPRGPAESHSPSTAAATRAESRGSNSSSGGVSMVWADASSSPLSSGPVTSRRRPPSWGAPLFPPSSLLLYSYPILQQSTPGAWVRM